MTDSSFDLQHLLVHDAFVRSIARTLLSSSDADDAVQETWLRAAKRPPRDADAARPWLSRVVTNITRSMRRREGTRQRAELRSLAQEPVPGPDSILEREALRREIVLAVLALDAPYRDAIVLRYFEGLDPNECARRLSIPLNTFLSRVHRARSTLRERFTDADGNSRFSVVAMSALASPSRFEESFSFASSPLRAALFACLAAAGGVFVWLAVSSRVGAPQPITLPSTSPAQAVAAEPVSSPAVDPVPLLAPTRSEAESNPAIHGVVTDDEGRRVAGARIATRGPTGVIDTTTDSQGTFVIQLPSSATVDVPIASTVHFPVEFFGVAAGEAIFAVPRPAVPFRGRVVDSESGEPITGATVKIGRRVDDSPEVVATSDENGEFAGLAPRRSLEIEVAAFGYAPSVTRPFSPTSETAFEFRLARQPSHRLGYVRLRDAHGSVITDIETLPPPLRLLESSVFEVGVEGVATGAIESKVLSTNVDPKGGTGSIRLGMRSESSQRTLRVRSPGGPWIVVPLRGESGKAAADPAEVILPPRVRLRGVVTSGSPSTPVRGAVVRIDVVSNSEPTPRPAISWPIEVRTGPDGSFSSDPMLAGMHVAIEVDHELGRARVPDVVVANEGKAIAIVLDEGSRMIGRVLALGRPVEGARVTLRPKEMNPPSNSARVTWTDRDGRLVYSHGPDLAEIVVEAAGFGTRKIDRDATRPEQVIELMLENVIDGSVVDAAGRRVAGATVMAVSSPAGGSGEHALSVPSRNLRDGAIDDSKGAVIARTVSDSKGEFRLRSLLDGDYAIVASCDAAMSIEAGVPSQSPAAADVKRVQLRLESPGAVIAKVVSGGDGAAIADFNYSIESKSDSGAVVATMGEGHAHFVHLVHGRRTASVRVNRNDDLDRIAKNLVPAVIARDLEVRDSVWRELTFELPPDAEPSESTAVLDVLLAMKDRDGAQVAFISLESTGASDVRFGLRGHSSLEAVIPAVPLGRYRIEVRDVSGTLIPCDPSEVTLQRTSRETIELKVR